MPPKRQKGPKTRRAQGVSNRIRARLGKALDRSHKNAQKIAEQERVDNIQHILDQIQADPHDWWQTMKHALIKDIKTGDPILVNYDKIREEKLSKIKELEPDYFYNGELVKDQPHGYGIEIYKDTIIYKGQWKNGKKHGYGIQRISHDAYYKGNWENGKKHGKGTYQYLDGYTYTGNWKNDERDGQGKYFYTLDPQNFDTYEGAWVNDEMSDDKQKDNWIKGKKQRGMPETVVTEGDSVDNAGIEDNKQSMPDCHDAVPDEEDKEEVKDDNQDDEEDNEEEGQTVFVRRFKKGDSKHIYIYNCSIWNSGKWSDKQAIIIKQPDAGSGLTWKINKEDALKQDQHELHILKSNETFKMRITGADHLENLQNALTYLGINKSRKYSMSRR